MDTNPSFSERKAPSSSSDHLLTRSDYEYLMNISEVAAARIDLRTFEAVEYNDVVCRLMGITREECEHRYHHDMKQIFTGEYQKGLQYLIDKVKETLAAGRDSFTINIKMPTVNGEVWIGGTATFSDYDPLTKAPHYINAMYRDITDIIDASEKQEEARLAIQKTNLYRQHTAGIMAMLEGVPIGLGALAIHNGTPEDVIHLNRYFINHVAVKTNEHGFVKVHSFLQCVLSEEREKLQKDFNSFLENSFPKNREYHLLCRNGRYAWFNVKGALQDVDEETSMVYFVYTNIQEQKKAEAQLKENQRRYEKTVDSLQIRMWTYDLQGKRVIMGDNGATEDFLKHNCLPKVFDNAPASILDMIKPEDHAKILKMYEQVQNGMDASCEVWYKQRPGIEPTCQRQSYHVIKNEDGKPVLAYGVGRNITAEKKLEELYSREMEYLHNNSDESLISKGHYNLTKNVILDYESRIEEPQLTFQPGMSYDHGYREMLTVAYDEEERHKIAETIDRQKLIARNQEGETTATFQFRKDVPDDKPIWISVTVHSYTSPTSGDVELFSYAYDITERMLMETVMKMISQYGLDFVGLINVKANTFELLLKSDQVQYPAVHQKVDFDTYRNYACTHYLTGMDKEHILQMTRVDHIIRLLNMPLSHTVTFLTKEEGKTYCKQLDIVWLDEKKTNILLVRTDVTPSYDRDQLQLARIEATRLEAVKANEAKSTFLSSMSHDLRTPLNGVLGFTSFALKENDPAKKQNYLEKIQSSGKLLLDLVNDTLELSRIESGKAVLEEEAVNEADLVPAIVSSLRPSAELKGITLKEDYHLLANRTIWCDKLKAEKIVLNLLSNAIKYTPEGGTVSIGFQTGPEDMPSCRYSLCIEDNGIGMSHEFMARMFEPFSQEKRAESLKTPGTGLGLSIVKKYVDLMQGRIEVSSQIHKGTRWVISLPIGEASQQIVREKKAAVTEAAFDGKKVLLCEDNYMNREIAGMILKEKGVIIEEAENGESGLLKFESSPAGYYDAILMDMCMPVMDGPSAVQKIRCLPRADAERIPIIAMSADVFEESIHRAEKAGMDAYVTKPIDPEKLFTTLGRLLNKVKS